MTCQFHLAFAVRDLEEARAFYAQDAEHADDEEEGLHGCFAPGRAVCRSTLRSVKAPRLVGAAIRRQTHTSMGMTLEDVDAFAMRLRGVTVGTKWAHRTWMVGGKGFAWQRPFSKADLARFGDATPPAGEILAVSVENLDAKDALLAIAPPGFFTIPHFNGYPAVLIALRQARKQDVRAAILDAFHAVASSSIAPRARKRRGTPARRAPAATR